MKKSVATILLFACCMQLSAKPTALHLAQNQLPSGFGKTHFIMGTPRPVLQDPMQVKRELPSNARALFSPDDNIRKELVQLIDMEKEGITLAVFLLTDQEIADALVRAHKRGVPVEVVTDSGCLRERHNKIGQLCNEGCAVYVYNPAYNKKDHASLMHHKFAVFKNNRTGNQVVWTGSFNFTKSANNSNQENAVLIEDKQVSDQFEQHFAKLKERSYRYGTAKKI